MVDKEKVHLMCKGAIYEKEYGTEDMRRTSYLASDYVRYNLLKTLIGVTICFIIISGALFIFSTDEVLEKLVELDFKGLFSKYAVYYIIVLIIYTVISIIFYAYQYHISNKRIKNYVKLLDKVNEYNGVHIKDKKKSGNKERNQKKKGGSGK